MQDLLWLLLPVAAASGWWMAHYSQNKKKAGSRAMLKSAYGQSLNYLINEEPDKATEVLVQMVEVEPDTIELHLALGSLFRRRGEVDRAIRVHQNIIARARLSDELRTQATLELGRDFLKAGLLDRAEQLMQNLLDRNEHEKEVCQHLIDLYQQEKEWQKAVEIGTRLDYLDSVDWQPRIAQYHCELGEIALENHDKDLSLTEAGKALVADANCVRATLLTGDVYQLEGDYQSALESYQRVEQQNPSLMPEVVEDIWKCYTRLDDPEAWENYFGGLVDRHSKLVYPRKDPGDPESPWKFEQQVRYRCEACGFTSRKLFWQCPGCQCWSSVKPIPAGSTQ